MDDRRADPQRVKRADLQLVKRAFPTEGTDTCRRTEKADPTAGRAREEEHQEHGQLQAKDYIRKTGCGRKAAWVLDQDGRSQDTRDATRIQGHGPEHGPGQGPGRVR